MPKSGDSERDLLVKFLQNGGGGGSAAFADITGAPEDNAALAASLAAASSATGLAYVPVSISWPGLAVDETIFGGFIAPEGLELAGMIITAEDPPTGANLTIDIVNAADAEQTKIGTLNAGATVQKTIFGTPLVLAADALVRFKFKSVGSTNPGDVINVIPLLQAPS